MLLFLLQKISQGSDNNQRCLHENKCYYSPEFTSTLLSNNDIFEALPMQKDYYV